MRKTRISLALHRIFNEAGHQLASGFVIDEANSRLLQINGWVIQRNGPRRGRKRNLNRTAAVVMAHNWHRACLGMTAKQADRELVSLLGYAEERAVTRARSETKRKELSGKSALYICSETGFVA